MIATNHALTGALIGLAIGNPAIAVPVAFVSHFALDAIPHFDPPGDEATRIGSKQFRLQLLADASLCGLLVLCLALTHPRHWITAAFSAFAATSPDLFWIPKFLHAQKTGNTMANTNLFWKFHSWVQWCTGPKLWPVEAAWFLLIAGLLVLRILQLWLQQKSPL